MSTTKNWKTIVWKKSNGVCAHCGKSASFKDRTIDHVIPQAVGGTNDQRNLMPLCAECNKSRASGDIIPKTYYKHASAWALNELDSYIFEWKLSHKRSDGTMERFGIME